MPLATLPCQLQSCALHRYKTAESPWRMKPVANEKQTPLCSRCSMRAGLGEREGVTVGKSRERTVIQAGEYRDSKDKESEREREEYILLKAELFNRFTATKDEVDL